MSSDDLNVKLESIRQKWKQLYLVAKSRPEESDLIPVRELGESLCALERKFSQLEKELTELKSKIKLQTETLTVVETPG